MDTTTEYRWLNEASQTFLERGYLLPGQTVDQRVRVIAETASRILRKPEFADKFIDYMKRGWFSLSTPVWANFGNKRGLPISCFNSHIDDTMESILYTQAEVGMMSKFGGGTSAYFGNLRHRGAPITDNGESSGPVSFMQLFDVNARVINQGEARRGSFAAWLPISHPDIAEFLNIQSEGNPIQKMSFGVTVTDEWMNDMIAGNAGKRKVWARVLEVRANTGYPYIFFKDNVNNNTVDVYKAIRATIESSNLCTEVCLPSSSDESFVCDLGSMNLVYYDEWKGTDAVKVLVWLLDAVMTEFIEKAKGVQFMERAVQFAERHRAIGVGVLGWHSYLQENMIAFESMKAKMLNIQIFKLIQEQCLEASKELALEYGEPEVLKGYGRRNTTLTTLPPTTSTAFIMGQISQSIEPHKTNYYIKDLAKIKYTVKNPILEKLLEEKGYNTPETWKSIALNHGSVQHLDCLNEHEKNVFKTFAEISSKEVLIQAAARQKYIDQSQSLNLMIHPSIPVKEVNALIIEAWQMGIKTLYYQHSINAAQSFARDILACVSCES